MKMKSFDWSRPQRQPVEGIVITLVQTAVRMLKNFWPLLLVVLLNNKPEEEGAPKLERYEILIIVLSLLTVLGTLLQYFFFRFYIEDGHLIVKSGWLKKMTKTIPLSKIQTANIDQGPVHQLLGIVKLSVDTAGSQKTEVTFDALRRPMAEALQEHLLQQKRDVAVEEVEPSTVPALLELKDKDLLKLAFSANHLEALFILLFFGLSLLDNLKIIGEDTIDRVGASLPAFSLYPILFLSIAVLLVTLLFSTGRVFFRYYGFKVAPLEKGLHIRSGLTHVKERMLPFQKVQYISWQASWMRKLLNYWILEYHMAGDDDPENAKQKGTSKVPVTQAAALPGLIKDYQAIPDVANKLVVRMHPAFVWRRLLIWGIAPAAIVLAGVWLLFDLFFFWILMLPLLVGLYARLSQRKFRLWALDETIFIRKGHFGEEYVLLNWQKVQLVQLNQSLYQKQKGLATIYFHTAAGNVQASYIPLAAAQQLANYALFRIHSRPDAVLYDQNENRPDAFIVPVDSNAIKP